MKINDKPLYAADLDISCVCQQFHCVNLVLKCFVGLLLAVQGLNTLLLTVTTVSSK